MSAPDRPPPPTRLDLALVFETLTDLQIGPAIVAATIDCGGTYIPLLPAAHWGPVEHEISLMGVLGSGDTLAAAARNWTRNALRLERSMAPADRP